MKKTGYRSNDILNGEMAELRVRRCPYEYDKDNENECLGGEDGYCGEAHGIPYGWFYLPHSCNEWVIGTPEQAKALAKDILKELRRKP